MKTPLSHVQAILPAVRFLAFLIAVLALDNRSALSQKLPASGAGDPFCNLRNEPTLDGQAGGALQNRDILAVWHFQDRHPSDLMVVDKTPFSGYIRDSSLKMAEIFSLELKDLGVVHASDLLVSGQAICEQLKANPDASRAADRLPGVAVHYALSDPAGRFTADWAVILRQDSTYIRQVLTITAGSKPLPLAGLSLIDTHAPLPPPGLRSTDADANRVRISGTVDGSPLTTLNFYFGSESPLAENSVVGDRGVSELHSDVPIPVGQSAQFSSVVGIAPPEQMRRAFLTYLERERAHPYRTFLHYNSWFDIGFGNPYTQQEALNRIHAFGDELNKKRGVALDSFLFDDGWDDTSDLWKIRSDFKDGFEPLTKAAAEYGAAPGVWLSPWGGYAAAKQARVATAKRDGYEIVDGGLALSGPRYYALFHDAVTGMVSKYGVNQFKFDGTGNVDHVVKGSAFNSDFDAAIHLIGDLRQLKPDLFINLTTGTWPSPFWLFYADSIWRGGDDTEFAGVGTDRERWITYRDGETYSGIVKRGKLYPLNSLMLHGIVFAQDAPHLSSDPGNDFANEVRSYFGTGTQLQEMYITPSLLTEADWDVLAESAKWSRKNASTLVDTHWVGGDPLWLQVYGWAAWSPQKAILTLRNPNAQAQVFILDVAQAFELPPGAPRKFNAHSPWAADAAQPAIDLDAGKPYTFHLAPFQVLTLEAVPQQ